MALSSCSLPQVAASEPEESKSPDEEFGGMAGALARALEMRSNAIHGDSGKKTHPTLHVHCGLPINVEEFYLHIQINVL